MKQANKLTATITAQFDLDDVDDFVTAANCLNEAIDTLRAFGSAECVLTIGDGEVRQKELKHG